MKASLQSSPCNVLVVPDLETGNMLAKSLSFLANADALTSRADAVMTRLASCAVADPDRKGASGSERQSGGLNVPDAIAAVNAVSSSIKFSLFEEHDTELALKARGQIEGIYTASYLMQPRSLALLVEQEVQ